MNQNILKPLWVGLNLLLITIVIYFAVRSAYSLATAGITGSLPAPPAPPGQQTSGLPNPSETPALSQYAAITQRNLFKTTEETQTPKKEVEQPPPEIKAPELTDLNLTLWGTVTGPTALAYAIIEEGKTKSQSLKKIGDGIQTAVIKDIQKDHVLLEVNGQDEVLKLEAFRTDQSRRGSPGRPAVPPSARSALSSGAEDKISVGQEKIEDAVKNVNTLMKQVRIRPHFRDGKPDGLLLTGIRPGSIFADMGLKSGDIITGVDESPIESLDDALKFYQSLKSAKDVKLEIRRRGQPRTIDYTIE
ncbi:MAG: type II secretion system protein GspC [Desulfobacterales bacterium]